MAISITCGGCSATFEVPDTLAGKTIRCTSCQSQMAVTATATATAETKKPFGFGSGAKPANKGDEPTPAKTSPNAKPAAKPEPKAEAPKPAKKPVVVDDEDDEKPAPKAKDKPAPKAAAKKRRDDDDDDDDDDDRPRKKAKNKSGGSGPMVAIIVAGLLGVGGIAGLSIYLLSGDKKKTDTAANANTNTPPSGPQTPGMPGPGGPGVGGPGDVGEPGRPDRPDRPDRPGRPTPGMPGAPGGGLTPFPNPGAPGGPPGVPPMPGVGGPGTPGIPPMPGVGGPGAPGGGGNPLAGLAPQAAFGTSGPWAKADGPGFSAEFPGTPEAKSINQQGSDLAFLGINVPNGLRVMAMSITPPNVPGQVLTLDQAVLSLKLVPDFKDAQFTDATVGGKAGKEATLSTAAASGKMRLTVVGNRLFVFFAGGAAKNGMSAADQKKFFDSVKITYTGDAVAGGPGTIPGFPGGPGVPPMPGIPGQPGVGQPPFPGVPGQPGVGQPGFPGGGVGGGSAGNTNGNAKTKLDPFITSAFDAENKEFYTIEPRQIAAGRFGGALHRYSYPAFNSLNKLNLAQLGFRSALDAKGSLLYVAVAANALTVSPQMNDRASAVGSIAIFDLKALRDAAPKDGTDLKPVATISVGTSVTIQGLELSADGKSLYVLKTSGTGNARKSYLARYDTETRKENKSETLPVLALDFTKGPDGKTGYIVNQYAQKEKQSGVVMFDLEQWTMIKTLPIRDGAALDVAVLSGGNMLVTIEVPDAPMGGGIGGPGGLPGGGLGMFGNLGGPGVPGQPGGQVFGNGGGPGAPMGGGNILGGPGLPGGPGAGGPGVGGQPGGPGAGGPGGGALGNGRHKFAHRLFDATGIEIGDLDLGAGARAANGGYAEFSADGKKLFLSSWHNAGLDVYAVEDANKTNGMKLKHSIRTAKQAPVGGNFVMTPDGKFAIFNNGLVIDTANVGGELPAAGTGGGNVPGGFPPGGLPPGERPPGGMIPGPGGLPGPIGPGGIVPPGGVNPGLPGPIAPPGGMIPGPGGIPGRPPKPPGVGMPPIGAPEKPER